MAILTADARTTYAEVVEIIDTTLTAAQVHAFINTANHLVTDVLADEGLSETRLHDIEMWLAAHLLSTSDPREAEETIGPYRVKYQGKTDLGLAGTTYGQQVMVLDTTGVLARLGKPAASLCAF
jgi:hypothetical protein